MHHGSSREAVLNDALQTFQDYIGLKLHFNDAFVWNRNFRFNHTIDTLLKRKDAHLFIRMADSEPDREVRIQKFISAFKHDNTAWIGDVLDDEHKEAHKRRMLAVNSLKYLVRLDIDRLVWFMEERNIDVRTLLLNDGQSPYIIRHGHLIDGGISDETLALIERGFGFCSQTTTDPLWEKQAFMLSKYHHWLEVDSDFIRQQFSRLIAVKKT